MVAPPLFSPNVGLTMWAGTNKFRPSIGEKRRCHHSSIASEKLSLRFPSTFLAGPQQLFQRGKDESILYSLPSCPAESPEWWQRLSLSASAAVTKQTNSTLKSSNVLDSGMDTQYPRFCEASSGAGPTIE